MNLSRKQARIVNLPLDSAVQVLASAGAGKTRVLTERVRHILANTKNDGVIALIFTNKAAEEMTTRLADCNYKQDRAWIATVHSVAQRILEKYGHTVGLPNGLQIFDRDKDKMEIFMQSLRDDGVDIDKYLNISDSKEQKYRENKLQSCINIFSRIKRDLLTELEVTKIYSSKIWKIFQDYQTSLISSNGIDYDDILVYAYKILMTNDWIAKIYRSRYKHICVDEAQDLNKIQYEFIKTLCGDIIKSVLMVGDPNQMIYGFNGSSQDYLCKHFVYDFAPKKFELKENYRSTKAVIRVANKLKPNSQIEGKYALQGCTQISEFDTEEVEANFVTSTIQNLLNLRKHKEIEGDISLDKMVVIARNRFVFGRLVEDLNAKNIPFSLRKGERQLEPLTKFGKVLDYAMRIKLNCKDWVDGKKLCQVLSISEPDRWTAVTLSEIANQVAADNGDKSEILANLISAVDNLDIEKPGIPKFVKELRVYLTALVQENDKESVNNFEETKLSIEELDEFNHAWTLFKRKRLGESLVAFRNALALGQLSEHSIDGGLTLSTVHTMKGLEKDIVFLIGMCEGVFPDYRAKSRKELDEERNNAFVAVTRAKRHLYLSYPKLRVMPWGEQKSQCKSRFLKEIA